MCSPQWATWASRHLSPLLSGGLGSVPGAIVGAIILGVIETFVSAFISSSLRDFFSFALLIVLLLVKPSGLFGVDVQDKA